MDFCWHNENQQWLFCSNNLCQEQQFQKDQDQDEKPKNQAFYFGSKKQNQISKGALCYCQKKGYGVILDIKDNNNFLVKLKENNEQLTLHRKEIQFELSLPVVIISNNSLNRSSICVPVTANSNEIIAKINELNKECNGGEFQSIIYKGKELANFNETLENLSINLQSLFVAMHSFRKVKTLTRYTRTSNYWYFGDSSVDGIAFQVSKPIILAGIGIYNVQESSSTSLSFLVKVIEGDNATDNALAEKDITVEKFTEGAEETKITQCLFDKGIKIKADTKYSLVLNSKNNAETYYGSGGKDKIESDEGIVFTFSHCQNADNGTSSFFLLIFQGSLGSSSGQIPELYYYQ